jgi:hypothetical protein
MAVKTSKAEAALKALKALQEDARRKGRDRITTEEIDAEVAAYRKEKRFRSKADPKA